ncbi:MAG: S8 family peptidase, partial [Bacteroidota bacterium]
IYFAVQNEAKVINNSWGYYASTISPVLDVALQEAIVNDVVMVCSAGNGLEGTMVDTDIMPHWPSSAEYPNIISVAALDNFTDVGAQLASYSNFGFTSVDIAAEGTDIESTVPFNNLATFSGTSMAAAQVTRTAAIIRGRDSDYSAQDVVDCILSTAEFSPDLAGQIFTEGFLNTDAALLACFPVSTVQVNFGDLEVLPNPFSEYVGIRLPADAIQEDVQFTVFDAKGALVYQQQYSYTSILMWDGISQSGAPVPAGFYLYHLMIGDTIYTGKLIRNP